MRPKSLPFLSIFLLIILPHGSENLSLLGTIKRYVLTLINRVSKSLEEIQNQTAIGKIEKISKYQQKIERLKKKKDRKTDQRSKD